MADKSFKEFQKWKKRTKVTCQTDGCANYGKELDTVKNSDTLFAYPWDEDNMAYEISTIDLDNDTDEEGEEEEKNWPIVCPECGNPVDVTTECTGDDLEIVHYRK